MEGIKPELTPELLQFNDGNTPAKSEAFQINTYSELVKHVAKLAYLNKNYMLFYRGQTKDYKNKAGSSTFYPNIYREENIKQSEVKYQFDILEHASNQLIFLFNERNVNGKKRCSDKTIYSVEYIAAL
jgi:hypothetical protein